MALIPAIVPRHDDTAQRLAFKAAAALSDLNGSAGGAFQTGAGTVDGNFCAVTAVGADGGNAVIASMTHTTGSVAGTMTGKSIPNGSTIRVPFTEVTLTSGNVYCTTSATPISA